MIEQTHTGLEACYPQGAPAGFPVDLFTAVPALQSGDELRMEEGLQRRLDALMPAMGEVLAPVAMETINTFAAGVYARQLVIPKNTVAMGAVHLTEHFNVVLHGDVTILTAAGPRRLKAPAMFVSPPGSRKLVFANETTLWTTFHAATSTDPDEVVLAITTDNYADFRRLMDTASYLNAIEKFGLSEARARELSVDTATCDETPLDGLDVRASAIEGLGLFATVAFPTASVVCPMSAAGKRTWGGRYVNHSATPNTQVRLTENGRGELAATCDIAAGDEITSDYAATMSRYLEPTVGE